MVYYTFVYFNDIIRKNVFIRHYIFTVYFVLSGIRKSGRWDGKSSNMSTGKQKSPHFSGD